MEKIFKIIGGLLLIFIGALFVWDTFTAILSLFIGGFIFLIIGVFIFVSFGIYLFFYWVIPGVPQLVSKLCVYHKLKTNLNSSGETLWEKIFLVFIYNFFLTIPMLLTVIYFLNPATLTTTDSLNSVNVDMVSQGALILSNLDIGIIIALSIIPGLFMTVRLIGNPTHNGIFMIKKPFFGCSSDIQKIKDDVSSLFSTLIIGTILFLFLLYSSDYLSSQSYWTFINRYIPSMAPFLLLLYIIAYIGALFIFTIIGELILKKCVPVKS